MQKKKRKISLSPVCYIILIIFLNLFCSEELLAQEIPVKIKAEKLKFTEGTGLIEASGSVEVELEKVKIFCERARIDTNSNVATVEGKVRLFTKDYQAYAHSLTYDISREVFNFFDFNSQFSSKNVRGRLYVKAKNLSDLQKKMEGKKGALTFCDQSSPHFFLLAEKIEYYPEDRIEGKNVTYYVGQLPLLWLPYLRYDLNEKRKKNWIFGHNEVEGNYIKTAWDSPWGLLLLDYMEKKGWGVGTEVGYGLAALGLGTLYLYHQPEKETGIGNWVTKINHEKKLTAENSLKLSHRYTSIYQVPAGRYEQTASGLQLSHRGRGAGDLTLDVLDDRITQDQRNYLQFNYSYEKSAVNYYYYYEFSRDTPKWLRKSQRIGITRPILGERLIFNTNASYYHSLVQEGDSGEERVEPMLEFSGREENFSWRLVRNWFVDLRQKDKPQYDFLERQPELEFYPKELDFGYFSLRPTFGYGKFREVKYLSLLGGRRDFAADRFRAKLNASKSLSLGFGSVLILGAGIDQFFYSPGDQLYALSESASLRTNLASFFRNEINFRQGYTEGNTPFFFDQLETRYHDIREKMTFYYLDKFSWSIEGGHNWQTNKYFDVMTNLLIFLDPRVKLTANTGWDIENRRYKDLVVGLRLSPYSFFGAALNFTQDLNGAGLKIGNVLYDLYLLEKAPNQWHLQLSQVYDPKDKDFKVRDIMVVHDLHCWEMRYTYNDFRKEFSFVFTLKALPEEPVGYAPGKGFYFEGFEKELQEFKHEGEIRRY